MQYWGRAAIVYVTITALLYGTRDIWTARNYAEAINKPAGETGSLYASWGGAT